MKTFKLQARIDLACEGVYDGDLLVLVLSLGAALPLPGSAVLKYLETIFMTQKSETGLSILVLAAGKGKRMKSSLPKVLHTLSGRPLLACVLDTALLLNPGKVVVIVGYMAEKVREVFGSYGVEFVTQEEQLGTGHAVAQAEELFSGYQGSVMILSGDVPLIRMETLKTLFQFHNQGGYSVSLLSADMADPAGYGRIIRNASGQVTAIVEERDASFGIKKIREINTGVYCVKAPFLFKSLMRVKNDNEQKEYYLTDIVREAFAGGLPLGAVKVDCCDEIRGINTLEELHEMEKRLLTLPKSGGVAGG